MTTGEWMCLWDSLENKKHQSSKMLSVQTLTVPSTCIRSVSTRIFSPHASPEFSISRSSLHTTHLLSLLALQHCTVWTPNLFMHSSSPPNSLISDLLLSFHIAKSHVSSSKKLLRGCRITQMFGVHRAAVPAAEGKIFGAYGSDQTWN